jgi:23S rRNA pseudouridine1911/1915/1917 synthase
MIHPPDPTPDEPGDDEPATGAEAELPTLPSRIDIPPEAVGIRLDTWLSRLPGAPSRNRVQQLVKDGHVIVNGEPAKRSHTLAEGDRIDIAWPPVDDDWPWPQDIPLHIVHHDDAVIVVNKQAGLVVHPSAGHPDGTMVNALLHHFPDLPGINGRRRPGIVHRLDRDTTGLIVVAKTEKSLNSLANQLVHRTMRREYLALAIGDPEWDTITVDAAVGMDTTNRLRRKIDGPYAKPARSHFTVLLRSHQFTLIGCRLETGRTHQIRVHLQHIGHPIVCDEAYDGALPRCIERLRPNQHEIRRVLTHYNRPWLHARTLTFHHPTLDRRVRFEMPPPGESAEVLRVIFGAEAAEPWLGPGTIEL